MKKFAALCLFLLLIPLTVQGQHQNEQIPAERVLNEIENAHEAGEITYEQALQQKFYAAFDSDRLSPRFSQGNRLQPLRCALPLISEYNLNRDHLPAAARDELEVYVQSACDDPPPADESYPSESGRFIFHYTLEGEHAVPAEDSSNSGVPDYIEKAEFAADSSWNHLIGSLGFEDPVLAADVAPYEIYFQDFSFYGIACSDGATSYSVVNSNFEGFPPNEHPEGDVTGALYVTIAHEFKHASQYTTNMWQGPEDDSTISWIEMDAVMIEDIVFGDVNDYYNYIKEGLDSDSPRSGSIFGSPGIPIPRPLPTAYSHSTWMLYFAEKFGMEFWVDVWSRFVPPNTIKPFLEAVDESLEEQYSTNLEQEHVENMAWHLASGPSFSGLGFGFSQRNAYPDAALQENSVVLPDSTISFETLRPLAGHFIQASPHGARVGNAKVTVDHEESGMGVGLIGYFQDGTIEFSQVSGGLQQSVIETNWPWERLDKLGIAIVNTNTVNANRYTFKIESVMTEQVVLFQNYPNPFRESTRIQFTVDTDRRVRMELFDVLGRRIRTLADREYEQGLHTIDLESVDLASGVYIYRLRVGDETLSKKMMHIR